MLKRTGISKEGGVLTIDDEAESPKVAACLRYMMNRNRRLRGA